MSRPDPAIEDALKRALQAHRTGSRAEAERLYRTILAQDPEHPHALHFLGVLHAQRGRYDEACRLIEQSLTFHRSAQAYSHLGNALKGLRRFDDAVASYDAAIALDPAYAEAPYNRGNALRELGRFDEAIASYEQAIAIRPRYTPAHFARAVLLKQFARFSDAVASFDAALALEPDLAEAWNSRGNALMDLNRPDEAVKSYERAIAIRPEYAEAHSNRGNALHALGHLDDALASHRTAIALQSSYAEAHYNAGKVLTDLGQLEDALAAYDQAIALKPAYVEAHNNRGGVFLPLGRVDEALACYTTARRIDPDDADAHWNEGMCRLLLGQFEPGWEKYEWRWKLKTASPQRYRDYPVWPGHRVKGRLLGWSEQGLGDNIFFAGMARDLARMADQLVLEVDPRLVALFRRSLLGIEVYDQPDHLSAGAIDWAIPLGSVGQYLRRAPSDFAGAAPYLRSDPDRRQALRARLDQGSLLVGISWITTNPTSGRARTIPLAGFEPVLTLPGVLAVDLQYGDTVQEREDLERRSGLRVAHVDDVDNFSDIDGLAALITACDLVVTIDNTTAHLAAALGTPTFVLLSAAPDWRWQLSREDSPWYPSARLFRQRRIRDWDDVMARVRDAVLALGARR
jgi:tetratricopeptide (TPR) repeat protein